ncbi:hypothetical protein DSECCO2_387290 [anaerobic digester metagenome]
MNNLVINGSVFINTFKNNSDVSCNPVGISIRKAAFVAFKQRGRALSGLLCNYPRTAVDIATPFCINQGADFDIPEYPFCRKATDKVRRRIADGHTGVGDFVVGACIVQDTVAVGIINIIISGYGAVFTAFIQFHRRTVKSPDIGQVISVGISAKAEDTITVTRKVQAGLQDEIPGLKGNGIEYNFKSFV